MKKVCPVALLAALVVLASQGRSAAPPTSEDDSQRIIFLGEKGPLLIRLHLRVDGRSHRAVWREAVDGARAAAGRDERSREHHRPARDDLRRDGHQPGDEFRGRETAVLRDRGRQGEGRDGAVRAIAGVRGK